MSKVRIELNREGVRELLRSQEMMAICQEVADGIKERCGDGYATSQHVGTNRVNVSVYTESREAKKDNMDNNTMLCALGGGTE